MRGYFSARNRPAGAAPWSGWCWEDSDPAIPSPGDQTRAFNLAAHILCMVNCTPLQEASDDFTEYSYVPLSWRNENSAVGFIHEAFPVTEHPYFDKDGKPKRLDITNSLAAKYLKKAGLRFEATDDLRAHLNLDRKKGVVQVFHRTAVLKELLRAGVRKNDDGSTQTDVSVFASSLQ